MTDHREAWWRVFGALVAVVAPAAALHGFTDNDRLSVGLTAPPFGWPRLLVAHLVAAVPLGFVVAGRLSHPRAGHAYKWLMAAAAVTVFAWVALPSLAEGLDTAGAGLLVRVLVRSAVSAALVTPWIGAAMAFAGADGSPTRWQAAAAVVLATVPPGVYAERLIETRSAGLETLASTGRVVRARRLLAGLTDLGVSGTVGRHRQFDQAIDLAETLAAREPPPTAPASARLTRAFAFIQLDRPAEAESILALLADTDPTAALLLGALYRQWGRWGDAERIYQQVLDKRLPRAGQDRQAIDNCVAAYDGLAEARRNLDRPVEAAGAYREALEQLPDKQAYIHFQLGLHEAHQGRSAAALKSFAAAIRLDPALEAVAAPHVRRLRDSTTSCWLPRPPGGR